MSRSMLRTVSAACALTGLAAALSACSSSSSGNASSAASASSSASTAASASPSATAAQLTGTQLTALLPAASAYPSGYAAQAGQTSNSGSALETGAAKYSLTGMSCADVQTYLNDKGFGESAFATTFYASSAGTADFQIAAYQFADAVTAKTFYTSTLSAITTTCGKASFTQDGTTVKITSTTAATPSDITSADSVADTHQVVNAGGTTSTGDTIVALKGDDVLILSAGGLGSPEPTTPSLGSLTESVLTKLPAGT
jgi:hypothetical protein